MGDHIVRVWRGGEHPFMLNLGELRALQKEFDIGPLELLRRMGSTDCRVDYPALVIRYGLIGGGMDQKTAVDLVNENIYNVKGSMLQNIPLASEIVQYSMTPDELDPKSDSSEEDSEDPKDQSKD